jgi:hypothetical protein
VLFLPETIPSSFALHRTCVILRTLGSRSGTLSAKIPFGQNSSLNMVTFLLGKINPVNKVFVQNIRCFYGHFKGIIESKKQLVKLGLRN